MGWMRVEGQVASGARSGDNTGQSTAPVLLGQAQSTSSLKPPNARFDPAWWRFVICCLQRFSVSRPGARVTRSSTARERPLGSLFHLRFDGPPYCESFYAV